ncbi:MAG TPA: hypothetical protein VHQ41_04175, partial [Patescibacteria group bacterium]|nr:hypothetical protein [Patescibacteria group bacterium]
MSEFPKQFENEPINEELPGVETAHTPETPKDTFELNGIEVKFRKKDVQYPERIQNETKILGYERIIIDNDSLFDYLKKYYAKEYNIDLEKEGLKGVEFLKEF